TPSSHPLITRPPPSGNENGSLRSRLEANFVPSGSQPVYCTDAVCPACASGPLPPFRSFYFRPDGVVGIDFGSTFSEGAKVPGADEDTGAGVAGVIAEGAGADAAVSVVAGADFAVSALRSPPQAMTQHDRRRRLMRMSDTIAARASIGHYTRLCPR